MKNAVYITLLAACLAVVATFVFLNAKPAEEREERERYEKNLRDMQTHHKRLALNLLRVHLGYVSHYDFIDADLNSMHQAAEASLASPSFVSNEYKQTRDSLIVDYVARLKKVDKKIHRVKSLQGLVRTSERFSEAIHESIRQSEPDESIMAGLYQYQQMLNAGATDTSIRAHLESLAKRPSDFSEQISKLIPHAVLLASYHPVLLELTNETNDLLTHLEEPKKLTEAYNKQRAQADYRMKNTIWIISLVVFALVTLISILFAVQYRFRIRQIAKAKAKNDELVKALQERDKFSEQASTDPLTGLYNRRAFWKISSDSIESGQQENRSQAIIVTDLDGFKQINDEYGHASGDQVLVTIAARLNEIIDERDTAGRLGGDEFALLVDGCSEEEVHASVKKVHAELCRPIDDNNLSLKVEGSIGAVFVSEGRSVEELLSDADMAMYAGRENERGKVTWFTEAMRRESEMLNSLSHDLELALQQGQLEQAYQPILDLKQNVVHGLEVLARWNHPERGPIAPDIFIDVAQRCGFQSELDRYMFESSLGVLCECHQRNQMITMQINLCPISITPDFPEYVERELRKNRIDPSYIVFEITETWIVSDLEQTTSIAQRLVDLGVNLHLDDFGTGFSSLSHLQSLPINGLKIDRSFIDKMKDDERSQKLVNATVAMASSLDLEVVAEGIETLEQEVYLRSLGCDFGQGYLYSRPVGAADALELISTLSQSDKAA